MKIQKILKSITVLAIIPVLAFILTSSGGKNSESSGKKCPDCVPNTNPPYIEKTQEADLVLYGNLPTPSGRQTNYPVPGTPSLWNGSESATSLYDSPNSKYYCLVTVLNATGYKQTYVWESQNKNNTMKIQLPLNGQFQIRVEYYEKCGAFWTDGSYGRGKWYSEITSSWVGSVAITQWVFLIKENC
jgi:hypothetical protein